MECPPSKTASMNAFRPAGWADIRQYATRVVLDPLVELLNALAAIILIVVERLATKMSRPRPNAQGYRGVHLHPATLAFRIE